MQVRALARKIWTAITSKKMKEAMCSANAHGYLGLLTPLSYHSVWEQMYDDVKFTQLFVSLIL
jgi:hypothetical protein